jgi:hypothetical protein
MWQIVDLLPPKFFEWSHFRFKNNTYTLMVLKFPMHVIVFLKFMSYIMLLFCIAIVSHKQIACRTNNTFSCSILPIWIKLHYSTFLILIVGTRKCYHATFYDVLKQSDIDQKSQIFNQYFFYFLQNRDLLNQNSYSNLAMLQIFFWKSNLVTLMHNLTQGSQTCGQPDVFVRPATSLKLLKLLLKLLFL